MSYYNFIFDIDKGNHLRLENPFKYTISNDFSKQRVINSAFDVPNGFVKESSNEYQIWANLFFYRTNNNIDFYCSTFKNKKDYFFYYIFFSHLVFMFSDVLKHIRHYIYFDLHKKIEQAISNNCKIVLDSSRECADSSVNFDWDFFFNFTNLQPKNIIYITGDINQKSKNNIPTVFYNYWERYAGVKILNKQFNDTVKELSNKILNKEKRSWKGLCLNGAVKPHRITLCKYFHNNLQDSINYSFSTFSYGKKVNNLKTIISQTVKYFNDEEKHLTSWISIHGDKKLDNTKNQIHDVPVELHKNSYFYIVTETKYNTQPELHISEKIFKPILCLQPFIAVANPLVIDYLRRIGYDVFDDIMDHTYDTIVDNSKRMVLIKKEITRLSKINDWPDILYSIHNRLLHNVNQLKLSFNRHSTIHNPLYKQDQLSYNNWLLK